jgi:branched-chain amino acid transport system ATP-binding protein
MGFLQVRGLCKSFGGLLAISGLDFDVQEREIVGLVGPNGSARPPR